MLPMRNGFSVLGSAGVRCLVVSLGLASTAVGCSSALDVPLKPDSVGSDAGAGIDMGADLAAPPDLAPPPDLTPPPDLNPGFDATPAIRRTADWMGIIGTGQSLSVGAAGNPLISTVQPFQNMKLLDPDYTGDLLGAAPMSAKLAPLVEPIRGYNNKFPGGPGYPNNIYGETPHSAMANQLSALSQAIENRDYITIHSAIGESGQSITVIKKNGSGNSYAAALYEARAIARIAAGAQKTFAYGALTLTHGETDWNDANYEADIRQLFLDYNKDLPVITGQKTMIPLIVSQQGTFPNQPGSAPSTLAEWRLGLDYPGEILCSGPKYQYEYSNDKVHLTANGYRRMGEKYAQVYEQAVMRGATWKPLQPRQAKRAGAVITLDFDVPVAPLSWDDHLAPPHQSLNKQWSKGRGFEVINLNGALTISSVALTGASQVTITLDQPPAAGGIVVSYAMTQDVGGFTGGTNDARQGQLRDSDATVGYDLETIPVTVTAGSAVVTSTGIADFSRRSIRDVVRTVGFPPGTVIVSRSANNQATLSAPWGGASGNALLAVANDLHNYAVQFAIAVP